MSLRQTAGFVVWSCSRTTSGIEQNFDIEAKVLNVDVYLILDYRCGTSPGGFPASGCQWRAGVEPRRRTGLSAADHGGGHAPPRRGGAREPADPLRVYHLQ